MALTAGAWLTERAKLVEAQDDIQEVIDAVDAAVGVATVWDRTGVANSPTFSNSDLTVAASGYHAIRSTLSPALGKRYFEVSIGTVGTSGMVAVGAIKSDQAISSPPNSLVSVPAGMWLWRSDTYKVNNGTSSGIGTSWGSGDIIMVAWDDSGKLWFGRNGSWLQGDPAAGTSPVFTGLSGNIGAALVFMGAYGSPVATGKFTGTTYTPPSGFSLLEPA